MIVATVFSNLARRYLEERRIDADIISLHGAVEAATQLGIANAIIEVASSGKTLEANNLVVKETLYDHLVPVFFSTVAFAKDSAVQVIALRLRNYFNKIAEIHTESYFDDLV
jgi:ATP phosphoribosyltransferase